MRQLLAELAEARERAERAEATNKRLPTTLNELEAWRAELERSLTATTDELGATKAAREAGERELRGLRAALAEAQLELALRARGATPMAPSARPPSSGSGSRSAGSTDCTAVK